MKYRFKPTEEGVSGLMIDGNSEFRSADDLLKYLCSQRVCVKTEGNITEVIEELLKKKYIGKVTIHEGKRAMIKEVSFSSPVMEGHPCVILFLAVDSTPGLYRKLVNYYDEIILV